jgi:hypothetical protein
MDRGRLFRGLSAGLAAAALALAAEGAQAQVLTPLGYGYAGPFGYRTAFRPFASIPPFVVVPPLPYGSVIGLPGGRPGYTAWVPPYPGYDGGFYGGFYGGPYYQVAPYGFQQVPSQAVQRETARLQFERAQEDQRREQSERATVRLRIEPNTARLYLDGKPIGRADQFTRGNRVLRLAPGTYRLEAIALGYDTLTRELEVKARQTIELEAKLEKSEEAPTAVPAPKATRGKAPAKSQREIPKSRPK